MLILAFDTATDVATSALVTGREGRRRACVQACPGPRRRAGAHRRRRARAGRGRGDRGRHRTRELHRPSHRARHCASTLALARRARCRCLHPRRARRGRARGRARDRRPARRGLHAGERSRRSSATRRRWSSRRAGPTWATARCSTAPSSRRAEPRSPRTTTPPHSLGATYRCSRSRLRAGRCRRADLPPRAGRRESARALMEIRRLSLQDLDPIVRDRERGLSDALVALDVRRRARQAVLRLPGCL